MWEMTKDPLAACKTENLWNYTSFPCKEGRCAFVKLGGLRPRLEKHSYKMLCVEGSLWFHTHGPLFLVPLYLALSRRFLYV